ncbi:UNVERIFIED_CONTAM: hypothetical protein RMT77_003266 [Armadillidium vulgare]
MFCKNFWKYFCLVFIVLELIVISIHIFSQGFLLTRDTIANKSKCTDFDRSCTKNIETCILPKKFNKTVLLIVDALRYDFVIYDEKLKNELYYQNKIRVISEILKVHPHKSRLFKFIADPPTTTMQRLKGLTTGSLPTFIDASHNFASSEISEDNLIDQLKNYNKKIVVLGDDTWGDLFPGRFFRSFLFPSFNVMDLDTVDNGILDHIYEEIKNKDWDVIIAHFLGIDHCGHRYGPSNLHMTSKLEQMDAVLRNVSGLISEDTLLVVMGDHGMTATGDHGGDSKDEVETVLFFYSPGFDLPVKNSKTFSSVSQIDLVPTLASLLGVPIPYSNLGKVIDEVMQFDRTTPCSYDDALFMNYQQVSNYLKAYQEMRNEFPESVWSELKSVSSSVEKVDEAKRKEMQIVNFLNLAKSMCEEIWAKFNISLIIIGLLCFAFVLVIVGITLPKSKSESIVNPLRYMIVLFLVCNTFYGISFLVFDMRLNVITCIVLLLYIFYFFNASLPLRWNAFSVITVLLVSSGTFSNSFVVMEDLVIVFICISFTTLVACNVFYKKLKTRVKSKNLKWFSSFSKWDFLLLCCLISIILCLRMSRIFLKCREEQHWCDTSSLVHVSLNGLPREFHNARYFTSLISLVAVIFFPQRYLQRCGNLNGYDINIVIAKCFPILSGLLISAYWALQSVPSIPGNIARIAVHLPQLVYLIMFVGILLICYNPLFVYILPSSESVVDTAGTPVIPQLFMKLKKTYESKSRSRKAPVVYGLATSVSAPLVILISLISLPVVVITGDGVTPGVILLMFTGVLTAVFYSFIFWDIATDNETLLLPNWTSIVTWFLLSIYGFFATGHQATFPTLNWNAAFVGYDGTGTYLIPSLLVIINTFSSQLLFGISLPLLITVPLSLSFLWPPIKREKDFGETGTRGEYLLVERPKEAKETLTYMAIFYILLHSFKVFMSCIASFILRRHLMVWKIFAPHFIFEAVGLGVTLLAVLAGLLFTFRVLSALESWSKKL